MLSPHLLVPHKDKWPLFDEVLVATFSPDSSSTSSSPSVSSDPLPFTFPSHADLASMPIPPSRSPPRNKNPDHIPRPRNAFMLFRSAFAAAQKISSTIEHDNRHITRIIAHCWHRLSDAEKQVWRDKAAAEKAQHAQRYPNYRFNPVSRASKPVKRKVRRNGAEDVKRCETLAELVMLGKHGSELESAIKEFDNEQAPAKGDLETHLTQGSQKHSSEPVDNVPPFRSPLLPPTEAVSPRRPDENLLLQHIVQMESTPCVEPQAFYSSPVSNIGIVEGVLDNLFVPPPYYQTDVHTSAGMPWPRSVPSSDQCRRIMDFVQNSHVEMEQSIPDFTPFSWNQSDSFSFFH